MTALLAIQNDDFSILLSDRRITIGTLPTSDQYGKSGVVYCSDGRFAYAFTGLAEYRRFQTSRWLVETIRRAATPSCGHQNLIQNATKILNEGFYKIPELANCPKEHRRLTLVFVGHFWNQFDIYGRLVAISNFEDFHPVPGQQRKTGKFHEFVQTQNPQCDYYSIWGFGNWLAIPKAVTDEISKLVISNKPREAVVNKSISLLRKIADTAKAKKNIGKDIDEIFIPHDPRLDVVGKYHTARLTDRFWTPTLINACGDSVRVVPGLVLTKVQKTADEKINDVPRVRMRSPCPCGSGKRYKYCHGDRARRAQAIIEF